MSEFIVRTHNTNTDKIVERKMTTAEVLQANARRTEAEEAIILQAEAQTTKAALLAKLGITEEEARLLLS